MKINPSGTSQHDQEIIPISSEEIADNASEVSDNESFLSNDLDPSNGDTFTWENQGYQLTELDDDDVLRYFIRAAQANRIKELEELLKPENHRENYTKCLEGALNMSAYCGYLNIVELLINSGADPERLVGTTAYTNYPHIEMYLNKRRGITM